MTEQQDIQARKAASAAGAAGNSGVGVDGDDPSIADGQSVDATPGADSTGSDETERTVEPDPVTGSTRNAVGKQQAAENKSNEPAG